MSIRSINKQNRLVKKIEKEHQKIFSSLNILKKGDLCPRFFLKNAIDEELDIFNITQKHNVLLFFFRGKIFKDDVEKLTILKNFVEKFKNYDTKIIGVTNQDKSTSLKMHRELELNFEILIDNNNKILNKFGNVFHLTEETYYELNEICENSSAKMIVPALFLIDQRKCIRKLTVINKTTTITEIETYQEILKEL